MLRAGFKRTKRAPRPSAPALLVSVFLIKEIVMTKFRVWPNGVVQEADEEPYSWLSDDYMIVEAEDEEDALVKAGV